jgi:hypothetical protein
LLGLRRPRDWAVLRPRAFEAGLESLLRSFRVTVADVDADLEGEAECGSIDVEERHLMGRSAVARADVVVVAMSSGLAGVHRGARIVDHLLAFGVDAERVLPVVNRAPRSARQRAEITQSLAAAITALRGGPASVASPTFVGERRRLDDAHRDSVPLPRPLAEQLRSAAEALLERSPARHRVEPEPVTPGSIGSWATHVDEGP